MLSRSDAIEISSLLLRWYKGILHSGSRVYVGFDTPRKAEGAKKIADN